MLPQIKGTRSQFRHSKVQTHLQLRQYILNEERLVTFELVFDNTCFFIIEIYRINTVYRNDGDGCFLYPILYTSH